MRSREEASRKRIGELLVMENLITPSALNKALATQKKTGGKIAEILIDQGDLTIRDFVRFLARQPGVAAIDIQNYTISRDLLNLVPRQFAIKHEVFPIDRMGSLLTVAMACPLDLKTIHELEEATGLRVKALLCSAKDIHATIQAYCREEVHADDSSDYYREIFPVSSTRGPAEPAEEIEIPDLGAEISAREAEEAAQAPRPEPVAVPPEEEEAPFEWISEVSASIKMKNVASLVRAIENLPSLPATVQRLQRAMADPDVPIQEVSRVVELDPVASARMLRVVNSAAFGLPNRVESVARAVVLLGLRETFMIVLATTVPDLFSDPNKFDYRAFWQESLFCATACNAFEAAFGKARSGRYFTAGLLHDLGRVALAEAVSARYAQIDKSLQGQALIEMEEELLGIAHPEAGYLLADKWHLPPDLTSVIRFHHRPEDAPQVTDLIRAVSFWSSMLEAMNEGDERLQQAAEEGAKTLARFRVGKDALIEVARRAKETAEILT